MVRRRNIVVRTRRPTPTVPSAAGYAIVAVLVAVVAAFSPSVPASAGNRAVHSGLATAAKKSTKKRVETDTVPPTVKLGPSLDVKKLAEATRVAALRDATRFRVSLGKPVCPSGSPLTTTAVQCLVALGKTTVAYLVKPNGSGDFSAEPTFPIIAMRDVESVAAAGVGSQAKAVCGKDPFQSLPPGSKVPCSVVDGGRTRTIVVRVVDRLGTLRVDA